MKKKILSLALVLAVTVLMSASAFADLAIKPVPDPWDDPSNQELDGASYYAHNEAGYVVVWETPECNVDGKYVLLKNENISESKREEILSDVDSLYNFMQKAGEDARLEVLNLNEVNNARVYYNPKTKEINLSAI